jgi:hypothetical protein
MVVNLQSYKETYLKLRIIRGTEQGDELPSLHYMINCVALVHSLHLRSLVPSIRALMRPYYQLYSQPHHLNLVKVGKLRGKLLN